MVEANGTLAPAEDGPTSTAVVAVPSAGAVVAVSDVRPSFSEEELASIKKLATQTKAIGIILPPPDIRAIVDKTASFVAKHGAEFEKRILNNEKGNVKFNFLVPTDPYHAYYKMRIKDFSEPEKKEGEAAKEQQATGAVAAAAAPALAAPAVEVIPHALAKLEKPEDEMYTVHVPEGLTYLDLDIMRLTAQFVARNGKNFLTGLSSREHTNPQFNFLKPTHSLFSFFTALCDAYSRVLMPPKGTKEKLGKDAADSAAILERCLKRLEWERVKEKEAQDIADEAERERIAMQAIDWHDFVVVETIEFFDDEDDELPPPLTLKDVIAMNKAREYEQQEEPVAAAAEVQAAPEVQMTEEEQAMVAEAAAVAAAEAGAGGGVTAAPDTAPPMGDEGLPHEAEGGLVEVDMDQDEEQPIRIVKNYKKSDRVGRQDYDPTKFVVSPITGELVPIEDMAEHMRISLIDPRWKEQREAMLAKFRDTTKAADDEITRNLVGLAKTRPDIFGSTDEEVSQVVTASIREKLMSGRPMVWDGATAPTEGYLKAIKESQAANADRYIPPAPSASLGPRPVVTMTPGPRQLPPPPGAPTLPPTMRPPTSTLPPPPGLPQVMRPGMPPSIPQPGQLRPSMPTPPPMVAQQRPPMPPPPQMMAPRPGMPPPPPAAPVMMPGAGVRLPPPPLPPMMPGGAPVPLPPREAPPPMPEDQPEAKRQRTEFVLQDEEEFLNRHPGPSKVRVQCPEVEGNNKLIGQLLEVEVATLQDTVGHFKERLAAVLGLAANKQKLARDLVGFLRDECSLAHYNIAPDVVLQLGTKERGGRKK